MPDSEDNLRRRAARNEGHPAKVHAFRLDPHTEQMLRELKAAFANPTNPKDSVNSSAVFRRALAFYKDYALKVEVHTDEYTKLRYGSEIPVQRNRHRNPRAI